MGFRGNLPPFKVATTVAALGSGRPGDAGLVRCLGSNSPVGKAPNPPIDVPVIWDAVRARWVSDHPPSWMITQTADVNVTTGAADDGTVVGAGRTGLPWALLPHISAIEQAGFDIECSFIAGIYNLGTGGLSGIVYVRIAEGDDGAAPNTTMWVTPITIAKQTNAVVYQDWIRMVPSVPSIRRESEHGRVQVRMNSSPAGTLTVYRMVIHLRLVSTVDGLEAP